MRLELGKIFIKDIQFGDVTEVKMEYYSSISKRCYKKLVEMSILNL